MELLQLRYFQTAARMENITEAAAYHRIPQSAMSQSIARLEESLGGTKLFDRRNGRLFLNDKGRVFLEHVDKVLYELDRSVDEIGAEDGGRVSGSVRIKAMENHRLILTCIPQFSRMYPDVNFTVSHGYYEDQNVSYDIVVSSSVSYKHMSWSRPLIREKMMLAVHEDDPLSRRSEVTIAELRDIKLIAMSPQSVLYSVLRESCRAAGFVPQIAVTCDDPYFVRKYISENMGVSLVPEVSWRGRFRPNTVLVPVVNAPLVTSYLVMDGSRYPTRAVALFRDYLLAEARKYEGNLLEKDDTDGG